MRNIKDPLVIEFMIGLAGTAFAGYLSAVKFFTDTCALGESCPYFLGYPTCYYGFAMFLTIAMIAVGGLSRKLTLEKTLRAIGYVSTAGVVFAGWFAGVELVSWMVSPVRYTLVLPSCAYGLIFYVISLVVAVRGIRAMRVTTSTAGR